MVLGGKHNTFVNEDKKIPLWLFSIFNAKPHLRHTSPRIQYDRVTINSLHATGQGWGAGDGIDRWGQPLATSWRSSFLALSSQPGCFGKEFLLNSHADLTLQSPSSGTAPGKLSPRLFLDCIYGFAYFQKWRYILSGLHVGGGK